MIWILFTTCLFNWCFLLTSFLLFLLIECQNWMWKGEEWVSWLQIMKTNCEQRQSPRLDTKPGQNWVMICVVKKEINNKKMLPWNVKNIYSISHSCETLFQYRGEMKWISCGKYDMFNACFANWSNDLLKEGEEEAVGDNIVNSWWKEEGGNECCNFFNMLCCSCQVVKFYQFKSCVSQQLGANEMSHVVSCMRYCWRWQFSPS